jgi:hypothetical protein
MVQEKALVKSHHLFIHFYATELPIGIKCHYTTYPPHLDDNCFLSGVGGANARTIELVELMAEARYHNA